MKLYRKNIKCLILLLFIFSSHISLCQTEQDNDILFYNQVLLSLKNIDVEGISKVVYKKVDVTLPNQSGIYSPYQFRLILQDFFEKVKPDTFLLHNQYKRMNEHFIVGTIKAKNKNYRMCLISKLINNKNCIYQIRIEK